MKIKSLQIKNFKSIEDLVLIEPNPFSVFVGPNGAGKSNIFEALMFVRALDLFYGKGAMKIFGDVSDYLKKENFFFGLRLEGRNPAKLELQTNWKEEKIERIIINEQSGVEHQDKIIEQAFSPILEFTKKLQKIFLTGRDQSKYNILTEANSINPDGSDLEKVLYRILYDEAKGLELIEWLKILIPEFENIETQKSEISGDIVLKVYEKNTKAPFSRHLISDGTQNILALLTAVYQTDTPQFLCIEEPENGLHPYVIEALVGIFRNACKEKGHYIWLNTHSETLVRQLTIDEIIVVDKKNGSTRARQFQGQDLFGLEMDEAWLTNALGGGLP